MHMLSFKVFNLLGGARRRKKTLTSAPEDGWDCPATPFSTSALRVCACVCKVRLKEWNSIHCLLKWGRVLGTKTK